MSQRPADPELLAIFEEEACEVVETVHAHLLAMQPGAADRNERLEDVLRLAHDVKGSARVVGYAAIGELAHALEALMLRWRGQLPGPPAEVSLAFRATDLVRDLALAPHDKALLATGQALLAELHTACGTPQATSEAPVSSVVPEPPEAAARLAPPVLRGTATRANTLRVPRERVEAVADDSAQMLMDSLGAHAQLGRMQEALDALQELRLPEEGLGVRDLRRLRAELRARLRRVGDAQSALAVALRRLDGHARALDRHARDLRLVPVDALLVHLERVARDAAEALGRQVEVLCEGRDVRIELPLLEALKGPLTHAVRNAVDHGLESPHERAAAGKPCAGRLLLRLAEQEDLLHVEVHDDGRGVDLAAVRRKLGAAAEGLDEDALLEALLRSGLSTREQATQISGRGLGLGAAALLADRLRGRARLSRREHGGTRLSLQLPLQLSLIEGLVVRLGDTFVVLPTSGLAAVHETLVPAVPLATLLELPHDAGASESTPVTLRHRDLLRGVTVTVDAVVGLHSVVQRPLGAHLGEVAGVTGLTLLPGGEPALILDPMALAEAAHALLPGGRVVAAVAPARAARVLVVDDSATLREQLAAELVGAGFEVERAGDGAEALALLARQAIDAVVSDVQMPVLDGFGLLAACPLRPFLLVTAQPCAAGAAAAQAAGAEYLSKSPALAAEVARRLLPILGTPREIQP